MLHRIVDVTSLTNKQIEGPVTSWQTPDGPYNVEHLAGMSPNGDLLVFYWSPRADWQVVNVSEITGDRIAGIPSSFQIRHDEQNVEMLAVRDPNNSLVVF